MEREVAFEGDAGAEGLGVDPLELADEVAIGLDVRQLGRARQVGQPAVVLVDAEAGGLAGPGGDPGIEARLDQGSDERIAGGLYGAPPRTG